MDSISETQKYENIGRKFLKEQGELSLDQLDSVTGGGNYIEVLVDGITQVCTGFGNFFAALGKYYTDYSEKGYCVFCKCQVAQPPIPNDAAMVHFNKVHMKK